ncbi:VCBS repeat protein [Maribacter vaceletii]|uniref:VCBS repeat protein n=1 Tax=Maribacter vaceletii TaxID=1206816 RepID=A0A495ED99_9FLAO|nr:VCBS repeat-containing protein [Maribacter vaceletii]RKR14855.1 VCBS repeat protein [Maribacter vaceletii]
MKFPTFFLILLSLSTLLNCSEKASKTKKETKKIFSELSPKKSNISFSNILTENDSLNYFTYGYIFMGGGVSAGDINNDGLIDLFFTGNMVPNKLYLNKGNLEFEDVTKSANITGDSRWYTGVTMVDINQDGFLDIYCSVGGKFGPKENQLFINNGDTTFSEKAEEFGIAETGNSVQATFFDYDLDGDLDLYVANYPPTPFNAPNQYYRYKKDNPKNKESDKLYRNDNGHFKDVTKKAGVRNFGLSLSATVGDINQDGWPDLYVSNDFSSPDHFYINNKNGTFTEMSKNLTKNTSFYGMGVDIADINNDGLLDIFQVDMTAQNNRRAKANMASMNPKLFWSTVNSGFHYQYMQNSLQLNNGIVNDTLPDFSNISRLAGISSTDWSWGPLLADLDNDGLKDIFIANGTRREINNKDYFDSIKNVWDPSKNLLQKSLAIPSEKIDNFVYKNNGDLTFSKKNEDWGISYKGFSNGSVYADLDNDGDLEIISNNIDDTATIFENKSADFNNYLTIKLKGAEKNILGIGAKVTIKTKENTQFQELTLSRGFQSSVAPQLHFGIGQADTIETIEIQWPDNNIQKIENTLANQNITINHKNAHNKENISTDLNKLFTSIIKDSLIKHQHIENMYDDFKKEVLLPHQTSRLGPFVAVGDLNGDNLEDVIIGGSSQNQTGLYFQNAEGFNKQEGNSLTIDSGHEDAGIHIFDADNDGDNDVYIVSGGNEFEPNSVMLQDRFYVNDGQGNFTKSRIALPEMLTSGSRVYSHDYDKDGDLDLFVGGRLIPGNYPSPAKSYLLENISEKGTPKFKDATHSIAPDLEKLGLVTDASWADIDNDGWTDLVISGEWMPITVFKNNKGTFNSTEELGIEDTTGWWFSIKSGDFDNDGDIDFIAGNLGLNFKYKANAEETFDIYLNDFDKNEKNDIVLSYYDDGKEYPLRGRECSSQQIPTIKKKFEDYASFSTATLDDVYTEEALENSLHYQVKSFASVYIENKNGKFILHKLPIEAQISNINQIIVKDFDKDGNLDAVVAGNLYSAEIETPRNDASNGLFLKGDGSGSFKPIKALESGLFIPGDVKDMHLISVANKNYIIATKNSDFVQMVALTNKE